MRMLKYLAYAGIGAGIVKIVPSHLWPKILIGSGILIAWLVRQIYLHQDSILYHPNAFPQHKTPKDNPEGLRSPQDWGMNYVDVKLKAADGVNLHAWLIIHPQPKNRPTLIYFQGNAGNMGFRLQNLAQLYNTIGVNILAVSYRGYGYSEGAPSELGLQLDAEAALQFAKEHPDIDKSKIVLFGRSLGGAVSLYLASKFPEDICATIVENTFTSISDMVDQIFPILSPIKKHLLRIDWGNDRRVKEVTHPILFITGLKDELVPPAHMQKLYDLADHSSKREILRIPDGTHNETWRIGGDLYLESILKFLQSVTGGKSWLEQLEN